MLVLDHLAEMCIGFEQSAHEKMVRSQRIGAEGFSDILS